MFAWLIELVLPRIIGIVVHKRETLTEKEKAVRRSILAKLDNGQLTTRSTGKPVIVALIGLVGSGKSSVAQRLATHIGATVIGGDTIRTELRKLNERYERTRAIAEDVAMKIAQFGGNVILDSDFVDQNKRASLREKARLTGVKVVFVCTYCDLDVMFQRIREAKPDEFFSGASSKSTARDRGRDVKLREMIRRLPHHYRWISKGGGEWKIKSPPCKVLADIDTTNPTQWEREVERLADKIRDLVE